MNVEKQDVDRNMTRQRAAAEVIELGKMLFDTMIEAAQQPAQDKENDAPLIEEMRATADEFFTALRLLLETGQETGELKQ
jgi:hypothetical protein